MSEEEIDRLAAAVAARITPPIPFDKISWSLEQVAAHFHLSVDYVRRTLVCLASFPKGYPREIKHKVYNAQEVVDWGLAHKERH